MTFPDDIPPPDDRHYSTQEEEADDLAPRRRAKNSTRTPPHALDAERGLLGAMLLDSDRVGAVVIDLIGPGDFYSPQHQHIARVMWEMLAAAEPIDVITVSEHLRARGLGEEGPLHYLAELQNDTPSVSGASSYASAVARTASMRRLILHASHITDAAFTSLDPADAMGKAAELLEQINADPSMAATNSLDVADFDALLANGLKPPEPDLLHRSDGKAFLYAGKMHTLLAEPSSGKTWIALFGALAILDMGGSVLFIDYEDTAATIYSRMLALGAEPEALRERFRYVQPSGSMGVAERAALAALTDDLNPDLVVIDGVAEALERDGYSEDSATDVVAWTEKLPRPLARNGAAVLMIDHVVKDREQQGRYARGSGAKLAVLDGAAYSVKVTQPFSRSRAGSLRLTVAKDKPGGVGAIGDHVGAFHVEPHADGERVMCKLDPMPDKGTSEWKPTHTMARVMDCVGEAPLPISAAQVRKIVPGKNDMVSGAIQRLIVEGYLSETKQGRKNVLTILRPYVDPEAQTTSRPDDSGDDSMGGQLPLHVVPDWVDEPPPIWETNPEEFNT